MECWCKHRGVYMWGEGNAQQANMMHIMEPQEQPCSVDFFTPSCWWVACVECVEC